MTEGTVVCPKCGEKNLAADVRCWACDAELHPAAPAAPSAEATPATDKAAPHEPTPDEILALAKIEDPDQGWRWTDLVAVGVGGLSFVAALMAILVFKNLGLANPYFLAPFLRILALGSLAFSLYAWRKKLRRSDSSETGCYLFSCLGCLGLLTLWVVVGYWASSGR